MITLKKTWNVLAAAGFVLGTLAVPCAPRSLAGPSGGRNDGSRTVQLTQATLLLGATVAPGKYRLSWVRERGSAVVRLELARGKTVVAAGKGHWIESEQPSPYESLVYRPDGNGASGLAEIRFRGSEDSILIDAPDNAVADARVKAGTQPEK